MTGVVDSAGIELSMTTELTPWEVGEPTAGVVAEDGATASEALTIGMTGMVDSVKTGAIDETIPQS